MDQGSDLSLQSTIKAINPLFFGRMLRWKKLVPGYGYFQFDPSYESTFDVDTGEVGVGSPRALAGETKGIPSEGDIF